MVGAAPGSACRAPGPPPRRRRRAATRLARSLVRKAVADLTRKDIIAAARRLRWTRKMPRWTVRVQGNVYPARSLVLLAMGVRPNNPTNSHMAVARLEALGFTT